VFGFDPHAFTVQLQMLDCSLFLLAISQIGEKSAGT
jgi:hypothetical protein